MGLLKFADHECPYFLWVRAEGALGWIWESIDRHGRTVMTGVAPDRDAAFAAAALSWVGADA